MLWTFIIGWLSENPNKAEGGGHPNEQGAVEMNLRSRLLAVPGLYSMVQYLLAGSYRERYVRDFIKPVAGTRILDVGCGPGDIVAYLPADIDYVGFDMSAEYIEAATRRFAGKQGRPKCRFFHGLVNDAALDAFDEFDIVTANSVLHHLTDAEAGVLFELANKALRPSGRLITLDPCYVEHQSSIARFLLFRDRGRHIRTEVRYQTLATKVFTRVSSSILHDLLFVPYTNIVMECTK